MSRLITKFDSFGNDLLEEWTVCNRCDTAKPLSEFYENTSARGKQEGVFRPDYYCIECRKQVNKIHYYKRKFKKQLNLEREKNSQSKE